MYTHIYAYIDQNQITTFHCFNQHELIQDSSELTWEVGQAGTVHCTAPVLSTQPYLTSPDRVLSHDYR